MHRRSLAQIYGGLIALISLEGVVNRRGGGEWLTNIVVRDQTSSTSKWGVSDGSGGA